MDVKPECIQRTQEAIALGKEWKTGLEREVLIAKHEREMQMAKLAETQNILAAAQATMMQSITTLSNTVGTDHDLLLLSRQQLKEMQDWQVEESKKRDEEEVAKKLALKEASEKLEKERKERIRPVWETVWKVIQWAVIFILGIIASAVWVTYFNK
jgi:hypothetical protein